MLDVWEHAYYLGEIPIHAFVIMIVLFYFIAIYLSIKLSLSIPQSLYLSADYQNLRPGYISAFLDKMANWPFAEQRLRRALGL